MATLKNHPGYWLRDDAAAAFDRAEDDHGVLTVTDAGRTLAQQQALIDRWNAGGAANRPPYLYEPAMPASTSNHVRDGGIAVDIGNYNKFDSYCEAYGFRHSYPVGDPVHFDFVGGGGSGKVGNITSRPTKDVQQALANLQIGLGPSGVDGVYGPATTAAVAEFQKQKGLDIDGVYGPATDAALFPSAPTPPASGAWAGIQKMLKALYGYTGAIDNIPGSGTWGAMQRFLKTNWGYEGPVDGAPGVNTYKAMQRWLQSRYGYTGAIDGVVGSGTNQALERAGAANGAAF